MNSKTPGGDGGRAPDANAGKSGTGQSGAVPRDPGPQATASPPVSPARSTMPEIRSITIDDLKAVLAAGWADFKAAPRLGLFFGGVYAIGGIVLIIAVVVMKSAYLAYPLAIGFPLIGPFVAVGLYETSRRLESGEPLDWSSILGVIWQQRKRELSWMAFVILFVFWVWLYQIRLLLALFLGFRAFSSLEAFMNVLFTTTDGLIFLVVGHVVGAVLALILFSITVISCPLLLDRNVDFVTAMISSVKSVFTSPVPMLGWGVVVTLAVIVSVIPAFLGLFIVLPVLGHATWHLYRKAVGPAPA